MSSADTIFAPATLKGQSGVAVIRLSGPEAFSIAEALAGPIPEPRRASLRKILDPVSNELLDEGLVIAFAEDASFTSEKIVEFQVHGSVSVVDSVCLALSRFDNCRPAESGEFTRRAFANGRLDLTQTEGLADLIAAETREQQRLAQRVLSGEISDTVSSWREELLTVLALLEAGIDFADEEIPPDLEKQVSARLTGLIEDFERSLEGYQAARRIRDGIEVAIVGEPNVGKSTLLNHLAGRKAALTSEIAGTTRDVVEVRLNIAGHMVTILDTAGLRETDDVVETMGIERATERAQQADLRIFLKWDDLNFERLAKQDDDLVVWAKADLRGAPGGELAVSGTTGLGLNELFSELEKRVVALSSSASGFSHIRQRAALETGCSYLQTARLLLDDGGEFEILAENVRSAVSALDSLVGRIDVEDVLGQIFSRFCIGK